MKSIRVENVSKQNLEDLFKICKCAFKISPLNKSDYLLYKKSEEARKQWVTNILEQQGSCAKIAYLDGNPVAQIVFCPEETIPFINNPRKDVIDILCIYNPFPEARRKGAAAALIKDLLDECNSGLSCLSGKRCKFVVTLPFPTEGNIALPRFYERCCFRQGHNEMYHEIENKYIAKEIPEHHILDRDLDKTIIYSLLLANGDTSMHSR